MTRGIGDPAPLPEEESQGLDEATQQVIRELIMGQNKLHDRIIDLERKLDHMLADSQSKSQQTKWRKGL
jgi:hypothetical protein